MSDKKHVAKILIAEDDKFIIRAYADGLKRAGFTIVTANDGNEAVKKAREEKPDLILLDIIMPDKNGFETLREIKQDADVKDIPVVILSNLSQEDDISQCRELGAVDYLIKANYSMSEVAEKIKQYLRD